MCDLSKISGVSKEVTNFLQALAKQNEEHKLFQFLNGVKDEYK